MKKQLILILVYTFYLQGMENKAGIQPGNKYILASGYLKDQQIEIWDSLDNVYAKTPEVVKMRMPVLVAYAKKVLNNKGIDQYCEALKTGDYSFLKNESMFNGLYYGYIGGIAHVIHSSWIEKK